VKAGCPVSKIFTVPYGVDVSEPMPAKKTSFLTILTVVRMVPKKGVLDSIRAFAEVKKKHDNIRLKIICGEKLSAADRMKYFLSRFGFTFMCSSNYEYVRKVNSVISEMGLGQDVEIVYELNHKEVRSVMGSSDIFVLPSKTASDSDTEGLPVVLLEAQGSGLPVITTRHAGNPETLIEEDTGYLVDEGDAGALADRMGALIVGEKTRISMGRRARDMVAEKFSVEKHIRGIEKVYKVVLGDI